MLLYYFSIGEVKGFAYTLGLTTLIDVVVVFLFTKPMVTLLARTKFFGDGHPMSGLDPTRLGAGPRGGPRPPHHGRSAGRTPDRAAQCPADHRGGMMSRLGQLGGRLYRGEVSYDFVGRQRRWYAISGAILLISIVALFVRGLDFSVDFKGGAVFQFSAPRGDADPRSPTRSGARGRRRDRRSSSTGKLGNESWQVQTDALTSQQTCTGRERADQASSTSPTDMSDQRSSAPSWGGQITSKAIAGPDRLPDRDRASTCRSPSSGRWRWRPSSR